VATLRLWRLSTDLYQSEQHHHWSMSCCRLFEDTQLEDWTRLSGLTGLTLRGVREGHHGTLAAVLPRMTALQSLVLADVSHQGCRLLVRAAADLARPANHTGVQCHEWGSWFLDSEPADMHIHRTPLEDSPVLVCHASTTAELDRADGPTAGSCR
jgi:hypothetical protein